MQELIDSIVLLNDEPGDIQTEVESTAPTAPPPGHSTLAGLGFPNFDDPLLLGDASSEPEIVYELCVCAECKQKRAADADAEKPAAATKQPSPPVPSAAIGGQREETRPKRHRLGVKTQDTNIKKKRIRKKLKHRRPPQRPRNP